MYTVLKYFEDLTDNNRPYHAGETFPRKGLKVTKKRYAELASAKNRRGEPLIKEVKEDADPTVRVSEELGI